MTQNKQYIHHKN